MAVFHQTIYKTFFGLVPKQVSEWVWFARIKFQSGIFSKVLFSTDWFRNRFWNEYDSLGLNSNPKFSAKYFFSNVHKRKKNTSEIANKFALTELNYDCCSTLNLFKNPFDWQIHNESIKAMDQSDNRTKLYIYFFM